MSKSDRAYVDNPRSCVMQISSVVGRLCHLAINHFPCLPNGQPIPSLPVGSYLPILECMVELLVTLQVTAIAFDIPLLLSIQKKLALNKEKYPVEHCKVRNKTPNKYPFLLLFSSIYRRYYHVYI